MRLALGLAAMLPVAALAQKVAGPVSATDQAAADDFVVASGGSAVPIVAEANEERAVLRAAGDLAEDVERVSGVKPELLVAAGASKRVILVGTLGKGGRVDKLAAEGKISTQGVSNEWESYVLQTVSNPWTGTDEALVIAGSDRRGTIYGIYQLSEWIGVSPWYWWADVTPQRRDRVAIRAGVFKQGPPAVKYRGIFLNDEDWGLRPWASQTLEPEAGNIGPKTYAKVFELLLRLRANYLWPAMHPGTRAFNYFPTNREIADQYGIVMGSSHCEQMLRDNVDEWKTDKLGEYNYVVNKSGVLKYWEDRVRENARYENVYTLGMRGIHDSGMPGGGSPQEQAQRLHLIIEDQRELLRKWANTNVSAVPQIFCPYKEVLTLYRLAPDIPTDITLVWPDDNYGYVRQYCNTNERQRVGGAGVYYHVSYWGTPYDYLWLCTTPPALMREELTKAWDYGAKTLWVVNVGDLKPAEIAIEFFMRLAWNPHRLDGGKEYGEIQAMCARDFGADKAKEMADILMEYYRLNFARKPEHMGIDVGNALLSKPVFSTMANADEANHRLEEFQALLERATRQREQMPATLKDAYYQLVMYPVEASTFANAKGLALTRYYAYTKQGRAGAEKYVEHARGVQGEIQKATDYYTNQVAGGKWRGMMNAKPRNLSVFDMPKIPPPGRLEGMRLGIAVEGREESFFADKPGQTNAALPEFSKLHRRTYFVDVFNGGEGELRWKATPGADWIKLSSDAGTGESRIWVGIDWAKAPAGEALRGEINIEGASQKLRVQVNVFNPADAKTEGADFVEDNRRIVMEAEHASRIVPGADAKWEHLPGLGYNGEAMGVTPSTVTTRTILEKIVKESPCLEFKAWVRHPGMWHVSVRTLPTFSVETGQAQRYAVSVDGGMPKVVPLPTMTNESERRWQENVLRNAAITTSDHNIGTAGLHTFKVWMVDPGIVVDSVMGANGASMEAGYTWPEETRLGGR
jgi:hypothetical protein